MCERIHTYTHISRSILDDKELYVEQEAQSEALSQGAVILLVPILTSWQPDAQAAAAEALANMAYQNSDVRKQMQTAEAGKVCACVCLCVCVFACIYSFYIYIYIYIYKLCGVVCM